MSKPMPISVSDLLNGNYLFVIPSYQRGYRWEKKQVLDLLNDIFQFSNSNDDNDSYYLQPLVVKKRDEGIFEVLDGQQRLTTLLLILKKMFRNLRPDDREYFEDKLYSLQYDNRKELDFDNPDIRNPDGYYISVANKIISDRLSKIRGVSRDHMENALFHKPDPNIISVQKQVKFIWYEVDDSNELESIRTFNRLNKGKISLTSSELIKALFIMDSSVDSNYISLRWNEMERRFQDDDFWYFLSNKDTQTRIDILFDFLTRRPKDTDDDYSYRIFQKMYDYKGGKDVKGDIDWNKIWDYGNKNNNGNEWDKILEEANFSNMKAVWDKVEETFNLMQAWYGDNMHYNYMGFLVSIGDNLQEIKRYIDDAKVGKEDWSYKNTERMYRRRIKSNFKFKFKDIENLSYGDSKIKELLLLYNVETCKMKNLRFDFKSYKLEKWDIEHIDARNTSTAQTPEDRINWINHIIFVLEFETQSIDARKEQAEELKDKCEKILKISSEKKPPRVSDDDYKDLYIKVQKYFAYEGSSDGSKYEDVNLQAKDKDGIGNLTLLDYGTNRSYKDAPFPYKRHLIIEADKKCDKFIPICTRNVFLKYYSNSKNHASFIDMLRWNTQDKKDYLKNICSTLKAIFESS